MNKYDILIADDHPLFRNALRHALVLGLGADTKLVEVDTISSLEKCLADKSDWDLVLLDLNMPGAYGFSGLVLLRGQYPQIPVVMVSAQEEAIVINRSREFGAVGFIPKSSSLETIQKAIQEVLDGFELDVSEATVKAHITAIFRKLGVRTRTQAALLLRQMESLTK